MQLHILKNLTSRKLTPTSASNQKKLKRFHFLFSSKSAAYAEFLAENLPPREQFPGTRLLPYVSLVIIHCERGGAFRELVPGVIVLCQKVGPTSKRVSEGVRLQPFFFHHCDNFMIEGFLLHTLITT